MVHFGKIFKNTANSFGKVVKQGAKLGQRISDKIEHGAKVANKAMTAFRDNGGSELLGMVPGIGGTLQNGLNLAIRGSGAAARIADRVGKVSGRVGQYGNAVQSGNFSAVNDLAREDMAKHQAGVERRQAVKLFDELPQFNFE